MNTMYTLASYLFLFTIAGAWYWYSKGQPPLWSTFSSPPADTSSASKSKSSRRTKRNVSEKGGGYNLEGASSEDRDSKKRMTDTGFHDAPKPLNRGVSDSELDEEVTDDKAFAEQLNLARVGDKLAPPAKSTKKSKPSKTNSSPRRSPILSVADSATTGDADDDRSPSPSPALLPTSRTDPVADMLERPTAGPASIRITGEVPIKKVPKAAPKPQEPVETAKQRRARQKREEQKLRNEEAERVRRQLEDQQRRGARMAEGSSKQQKADAFAKSAQSNAWSQPMKKANAPASETPQWRPLDTSDGPTNSHNLNGTSSSATTVGTAPSIGSSEDGALAASSSTWIENIPSEEEQLRRFQQQDEDSSWNTVATKKKRGKHGNEADSNDGGAVDDRQTQSNSKLGTSKESRPGVTATNSYGVLKYESD